jgi:hypothetical protein
MDTDICGQCEQAVRVPAPFSIECRKCGKWIHHECARIDRATAIWRVKEFYCEKCREQHGLLIQWHLADSAEALKEKASGHYFEIDSIEAHKIGGSKRHFKVKWTGYRQLSWLPEENLDGCLETLQDYCLKNGLALSTITGKLGASSSKQTALRHNPDNWVTVSDILNWVNAYRNAKDFKDCNLEIEEYDYTRQYDLSSLTDRIFLIPLEQHCFVCYYRADTKFAMIADGSNDLFNSLKLQERLKGLLSFPFVACHFENQWKIDYCGSSAALLALEFLRAHKTGRHHMYIKADSTRRKKIVSAMHKFKSEATTSSRCTVKRLHETITCRYCPKQFRALKRSRVHAHELKCPSKPK